MPGKTVVLPTNSYTARKPFNPMHPMFHWGFQNPDFWRLFGFDDKSGMAEAQRAIFAIDPEHLLQQAKNGSDKEARSAIGNLGTHYLQQIGKTISPRLAPIVFHHLTRPLPVGPLTDQEFEKHKHLFGLIIQSLTTLFSGFDIGGQSFATQFSFQLRKHWKNVFAWAHYLFTIIEPRMDTDPSIGLKLGIIDMLSDSVLTGFEKPAYLAIFGGGSAAARANFLACPGYMSLLTRKHIHSARQKYAIDMISYIFHRVLQEEDLQKRFVNEILSTLRDIPDSMSVIVNHIRKVANRHDINAKAIQGALVLPCYLVGGPHRVSSIVERTFDLRWRCFTEGITSAMIHLILTVLECSGYSEENYDYVCTVLIPVEYLGCSFQDSPKAAILEALEAGILLPLAELTIQLKNFSPWSNQTCALASRIISIITQISDATLHPSVMRSALKAWKIAEPPTRFSQVDEHNSLISDLTEAWRTLGRAMATHKEQRREFKSSWTMECANPECCISKPQKYFQGCGSCFSAYYCSRQCQKRHWKTEHASECGRLAVNHSDISYLDDKYISWIVCEDFKKERRGIQFQAQKTRVTENPNQFIFYCVPEECPIGWGWCTDEQFRRDFKGFEEEWKWILQKRKDDDDALFYMLVHGQQRQKRARMKVFWVSLSGDSEADPILYDVPAYGGREITST